MGVWGAGLYSGDFAADLRSTVRAVAELPFDDQRLLDILREAELSAADDANHEDHTTFWLVVAHQFAHRGIGCDRARERALEIIDRGEDLSTMKRLGMSEADLRKRATMLIDLREKIDEVSSGPRPRRTLKKPQPLLMSAGDVVLYPTCGGKPINPYFASKDLVRHYTKGGPAFWTQDGWAAMVIVDCGRAFDFFSWYRPLVLAEAWSETPNLDALCGGLLWRLGLPGTCAASHFKKMELRRIGQLPVDPKRVSAVFPGLRPGISAAVQKISIANSMAVAPKGMAPATPRDPPRRSRPTLLGIQQIIQA